MALSRTAVEVWKMRFRRLYAATPELRAALDALTAAWAADAAETVSFTQTTLEGGMASGIITGNRLELLMAAEELLADPMFLAGISQAPSRMVIPDYTFCRP